MCLFASKRAALIETNLNLGFSKLAQDPVVKSASFVPIAIAVSVSLLKLFAAFELTFYFLINLRYLHYSIL